MKIGGGSFLFAAEQVKELTAGSVKDEERHYVVDLNHISKGEK